MLLLFYCREKEMRIADRNTRLTYLADGDIGLSLCTAGVSGEGTLGAGDEFDELLLRVVAASLRSICFDRSLIDSRIPFAMASFM